jgi:hypothetical protein
MRYNHFFSQVAITPPPPIDVGGAPVPLFTSECDFLLMTFAHYAYWVVNEVTHIVYEGNPHLLSFIYDTVSYSHLHTRLIACDNSWQILIKNGVMVGEGELYTSLRRSYPNQIDTQADIEQWADQHPTITLIGDGEKDWLIYAGKNNAVKSYIVAYTNAYILFFRRQDAKTFRKVWEVFGGIQLTATLIQNGNMNGNEGFGVNDSSDFIIDPNTGDISNGEQAIRLKVRRF